MSREKTERFFLELFFLIISPVYIPAIILWEERDNIKDYYAQCFRALTFQGED